MINKKLTLNESESYRLVDAFATQAGSRSSRRKQARNHLMILLMLDAGLRVAEVAQLTRGCLIFANKFCEAVTVTAAAAKNHRQRTIPSSNRIRQAILDMSELVWTPDDCPSDGFAFYEKGFAEHLTVRQIQRIVGNISYTAFGRRINPHLLRHTFASRLMRTVNIRIVQELLGHVSITSTQIYTHPNGDDLKNAIETLNASG